MESAVSLFFSPIHPFMRSSNYPCSRPSFGPFVRSFVNSIVALIPIKVMKKGTTLISYKELNALNRYYP